MVYYIARPSKIAAIIQSSENAEGIHYTYNAINLWSLRIHRHIILCRKSARIQPIYRFVDNGVINYRRQTHVINVGGRPDDAIVKTKLR